MAMEVQGSRRQQDAGGVKVKFIETQFISSDAASFKAVVQRLTGKSPAASSQPAAPVPQPQRPRPCRPAFVAAAAAGHQYQYQYQQAAAGWPDQQAAAAHLLAMPPPKQEPPRLEEMHELCDFADLFHTATAGARRGGCGGSSAFPY